MKRKVANLLSLSGLALAVAAIIGARKWPPAAANFPTIVAVLVATLATVNLLIINFRGKRGGLENIPLDLQLPPFADQASELRTVAGIFLWLAGFLLGVFLIGFPAAAPLFVFLYLRLDGKESWPVALGGACLTGAFIYLLFILLLKTSYQPGWLLDWLRHHSFFGS